jgi:hypothetical protein
MRLPSLLFALATASVLGVACATTPDDGSESGDDAFTAAPTADAPIAIPRAGTVLLALSQPSLVAALEDKGLSFASHFGQSAALANGQLASAAKLYRFIADDLAGDLDREVARDPKVSTQVANGVTRILDKGWLTTNDARFELTGIVNRIDRLASSGGTNCGEVRFLYRLAYTRKQANTADVSYSRLPVVANVVYEIPRTKPDSLEECTAAAKNWTMPSGITTAAAYVDFVDRTLAPREKLTFKQVEINAQLLRTPSESKTDMGGLAEYALRIYGLDGDTPIPKTLENTPDVAKIAADPALKDELAGYLRDHIAEVDDGTVVLPQKFLATKVSAFSTFGSARLVNKPFTRLFYDAAAKSAPALDGVDLGATKLVGSAAGVLARLDDLTCEGCHQGGRSVAGFHFLGEDSLARSHPLNIARVGSSPHLLEDLIRRQAFVATLARGETPSGFRAPSFAPQAAGRLAPRGAPCLASGSASAFKSPIDCAAGLACTATTDNPNLAVDLGICLPRTTGAGAESTYAQEFAGLPCLKGTMKDNAADPYHDALATTQFACRNTDSGPTGYACSAAVLGVPGGLCYHTCANGNVPHDPKDELCAYGGGKEFDLCAGKNDFAQCLSGAIKASLREACDESQPCREDYICQKFVQVRSNPPVAPADGRGYCVPTYFLFQVRVDGHPNPTPR